MERFGETRRRNGQDESDTGDKKQSRRCSSEVLRFSREKLEQDREFRSEDLQEQKTEREALENQLMIRNQQMQAQQSQAIKDLLQQQAQNLALLLQRRSLFQVNCV